MTTKNYVMADFIDNNIYLIDTPEFNVTYF